MQLRTIIASSALALTLAASASAQQLKESWTLEGQQVVTGSYTTDMSDHYFLGDYSTKHECMDALKAQLSALGPQLPPCLPIAISSACSVISTRLTCTPGVYAVQQ